MALQRRPALPAGHSPQHLDDTRRRALALGIEWCGSIIAVHGQLAARHPLLQGITRGWCQERSQAGLWLALLLVPGA